ncbi:hypothetical protein RGR602_CH02515 [Rhizobium gallicum bv. gallicum R602sp]|uniref:Uncharacterized protein n=1 Tax=Rhizobium gallicum bv. gallicum R602sp TaxID=1041138 RepID=A0A0B4X1M0_9HYPH|nr:hypothetical protein RGR602_CH02515 [Rhizobium gallicum bv. gallicum R602sp]
MSLSPFLRSGRVARPCYSLMTQTVGIAFHRNCLTGNGTRVLVLFFVRRFPASLCSWRQ